MVNVTNISNKPLKKVLVLFIEYKDGIPIFGNDFLWGALSHYDWVENLWPGEWAIVNFTGDFDAEYYRIIVTGGYSISDIAVISFPGTEIEILVDREYYSSIIGDLRNAEKEILVVMYTMIYDPDDPFDWANNLIQELVNAKNRGVNVKVIIEYRTYFSYLKYNIDAYYYLRNHGVAVKLDYGKDTDHLKLVIIDGKIVYIGSHNWSESSLYYNHEVSVKIIDETFAQLLKKYFETLWNEP